MINIEIQKEILKKFYSKNENILSEQVGRYNNLVEEFSSKFSDQDISIFRTPGRTEISGNHTDHNAGLVLAASVTLDSIAVASKNNYNKVKVYSIGFDKLFEINLDELKIIDDERGTTNSLIRGIAFRIKELGYSISGFNAVITSDVLKGSGLSSSASIEVLIGTIFNHFFNNGLIPDNTIAQISQYAENKYFGKPCGLMDQLACAVGGIIQIDFQDAGNPKIKKLETDFHSFGYDLLIVNTGGDHAVLTEDYASIPFEMKQIASEFGKQNLREINSNIFFHNIERLRNKFGDRQLLRTIHYFNENERVIKQLEALEKLDFNKFIDLFNESGNSSYKFLQNVYTQKNESYQPISLAIGLTEQFFKDNNCKGGVRIHGGGFAGTILSLIPVKLTLKYIKEMELVFGKNSTANLHITNFGTGKIL